MQDQATTAVYLCRHCGRRTAHERAACAMVCRDCGRGSAIVAGAETIAFGRVEHRRRLFYRRLYRTGRLTGWPASGVARLLSRTGR